MIVSQARIDANRRNAQLSTGPKTDAGKRVSRANALTHGLCASVCVPEDLELVQQRSKELFDTLKPQNELHVWMVDHAAIATIRIDRCERMERRARDKHSLKAELTWDDDRRLEAEILGRSLSSEPAETVTLAFYEKDIQPGSPNTVDRHAWDLLQVLIAHGADVSSPDAARLRADLARKVVPGSGRYVQLR